MIHIDNVCDIKYKKTIKFWVLFFFTYCLYFYFATLLTTTYKNYKNYLKSKDKDADIVDLLIESVAFSLSLSTILFIDFSLFLPHPILIIALYIGYCLIRYFNNYKI